MNRTRRLVILCFVIAGAAVSGRLIYKEVRWKRFAVVEPGRIYRSGQLAPRQLDRAFDKLQLKTVICLNDEYREMERAKCAAAGVDFYHFDMHSSGKGNPDDFMKVLEILQDPKAQPVLVHCSAGVARTGVAIAMYRMAEEGWSPEQAIEELRSFERRGHIEPDLREHILAIHRDHLATTATASKRSTPMH